MRRAHYDWPSESRGIQFSLGARRSISPGRHGYSSAVLPVVLAIACLVWMSLWPSYSEAQNAGKGEAVGETVYVKGQASATGTDGKERRLAIGSPIFNGDLIRTDAQSKVGFAMTDRSAYTVAENTQLRIKDYQYRESAPEEDSSTLSLIRGAFRFLTGAIGKRNPDDVRYETPVATIGIRGTEGEVRYEETQADQFRVCVLGGMVVVYITEELPLRVYIGQAVRITQDRDTGERVLDIECDCEASIEDLVILGERLLIEPTTSSSGSGGGGVLRSAAGSPN